MQENVELVVALFQSIQAHLVAALFQPIQAHFDWIEVVGLVADAWFILAYQLVATGRVKGTGRTYNILMLVQGVFFSTYAILRPAYPILAVEAFCAWIAWTALKRTFEKNPAMA